MGSVYSIYDNMNYKTNHLASSYPLEKRFSKSEKSRFLGYGPQKLFSRMVTLLCVGREERGVDNFFSDYIYIILPMYILIMYLLNWTLPV